MGFFFHLPVLVGSVLLVACANIDGILLTRMVQHRGEMTVRPALGGGPSGDSAFSGRKRSVGSAWDRSALLQSCLQASRTDLTSDLKQPARFLHRRLGFRNVLDVGQVTVLRRGAGSASGPTIALNISRTCKRQR
jgi:hypothetical protein